MTVFAVTPVVDYEPPRRDVPQSRQPPHPAPRRRARAPRRPLAGQAVKPPRPSAAMRQAAAFADAALRRVLEVLDRRRPAAQLRPMLTPGLVDSVVAIGASAAGRARGRDATAVLRRLRLQPSGRREPEAAAEVFGSYSRGDRIHAIACRVERVPSSGGWQMVALHIG
ncbi:Rv3235 family protein [Mycobacterium sp. E796]|uniref:Rv3235 family protein n=1 Tax=Mycobacterium sp. E796 TaxID=1834151 RepID=UPI0009EE80AB|nr:Rv3235 family protein [Mycobacterium sp. E796]